MDEKKVELTDEEIDRLEKVVHDQAEQYYDCEQRTAKEIYQEIDKSDILVVKTQEYGEIEVVSLERLKEIVESKGVEVE